MLTPLLPPGYLSSCRAVTSQYRFDALTNWAMKPLMLEDGHLSWSTIYLFIYIHVHLQILYTLNIQGFNLILISWIQKLMQLRNKYIMTDHIWTYFSLFHLLFSLAQITSVTLQNQKAITIFGSLRQYPIRWNTDCPNMHSQLLSSFIHTLVASSRAFLSGKEMQSFEV